MKTAAYIEKKLKKFFASNKAAEKPTPQFEKQTITDCLEAYNKNQKQAQHQPVWRIIMKSPLTKLTAAAAIIAAALFTIIQFTGPIDITSKTYAMSDIPDLYAAAKTLYLSGEVFFHAPDPNDTRIVEVEHWLDFENGRWRSVKPGMNSGPEGTTITVSENICDGSELLLYLDHTKKQASYLRLSPLKAKLRARMMLNILLTFTCSDMTVLDLYEIVGQEQIDGQTYDIWQLIIENEKMPDAKMQCWLSPTTGNVAKAYVWFRQSDQWLKQFNLISLQKNIPIPPDTFAMDIPADYTLQNTPETAPNQPWSTMIGASDPYRLNIHAVMPMPDGSVVVCWSSTNKDSDQNQQPLFEDCYFGGPLPALPYQINALKAGINGQQFLFTGVHLCYTQRENKFYEWALYVPPQEIKPRKSRLLSYSILYESNCNQRKPFRLAASHDVLIADESDFNTFVLGLMAEFSHPNNPLPDLTYNQVLQLAEQLRTTPSSK